MIVSNLVMQFMLEIPMLSSYFFSLYFQLAYLFSLYTCVSLVCACVCEIVPHCVIQSVLELIILLPVSSVLRLQI